MDEQRNIVDEIASFIETKDQISRNDERKSNALGGLFDALFDDADAFRQFRAMMAKRVHQKFNDEPRGKVGPRA